MKLEGRIKKKILGVERFGEIFLSSLLELFRPTDFSNSRKPSNREAVLSFLKWGRGDTLPESHSRIHPSLTFDDTPQLNVTKIFSISFRQTFFDIPRLYFLLF